MRIATSVLNSQATGRTGKVKSQSKCQKDAVSLLCAALSVDRAAFRLRIRSVRDLQPAVSTGLVDAHFPFCNDAFQISPANFFEEMPSVFFDVLSVQEPTAPPLD
jgi:hypothetical protein